MASIIRRGSAYLGLLVFLGGCAADVGTSSAAIVGGQEDGDDHPAVGALLVDVGLFGGPPGVFDVNCTGVHLGHGVLATAGHCLPPPEWELPPEIARVSFASTEATTTGLLPVLGWEFHPDYEETESGEPLNDVAVVFFDAQGTDIPVARLPIARMLDVMDRAGQLDRQPNMTVVGYGFSDGDPESLPPWGLVPPDGTRRAAEGLFDYLTEDHIHRIQAPGVAGGSCFGDSGGPVFWSPRPGARELLVGMVHWGNGDDCTDEWDQRLDLRPIVSWLREKVREARRAG